MQWLSENLGTILVSLALAALVAVILVHLRSEKRKGKNSCGAHCTSCPMSGRCHRAQGEGAAK